MDAFRLHMNRVTETDEDYYMNEEQKEEEERKSIFADLGYTEDS